MTRALSARYAVNRLIGTGGMATVYLARDLRHDRQVALKVLNPELGAALGVERFLAEIKVTAALQHPNLLPLFDSGEAGGLLFYVMPFVEGESLRARLERERQLPVDESIRFAAAIAGALDYAHRHGVVHRDLKPENVLLHEGQPLVADFGIALAVSAAGGARMTLTGLSLGTPQYMAPEQAMGERSIDGRADVFALGAVLYEMLAGEPPFTGPTSQAILAKVITERAPAVAAARSSVPAHVAAAIDVALEKVPADRFQSAAYFASALTQPSIMAARPFAAHESRERPSWIRNPRSWAALGLAAVLVVALVAGHRLGAAMPGPTVAAQLVFTQGEAPSVDRGFAVSPDGSRLAYVTPMALDGARLWIKSLRDHVAHPITGTSGAQYPFWSPDGTAIGFFANGHLFTVPATGGAPTVLAPARLPGGGAWNADGVIVYAPFYERLFRIPATGGAPVPALRFDAADRKQRRPMFLPDGRHFLYWDWRSGAGVVRMGDLATGATETLRDSVYEPTYSAPGILLYSRAPAVLLAQSFDLAKRQLTGAPVVITSVLNRGNNWGCFSISSDVLVYVDNDTLMARSVAGKTWWSRADKRFTPIGIEDNAWTYRISHDGRRVAFGGFGLFVYDVARGVSVRVPTTFTVSRYPVWSPGDSLLAYTEAGEIRIVPLNVPGAAERSIRIASDSAQASVLDWSPDGRAILFLRYSSDSLSTSELWAFSTIERRSERVLAGAGNVSGARFSPDGHWIAYASDANGSSEVYLSRYPQSGASTRISVAGGASPRWRADGRELYFLARDGRIMVATIQPGATQQVAVPTVLVREPITPEPFAGGTSEFEAMPAGDRFIISMRSFTPPVLQVVTGWRGLVTPGAPRP